MCLLSGRLQWNKEKANERNEQIIDPWKIFPLPNRPVPNWSLTMFTEEIILAVVYRTHHPGMVTTTQVTTILLTVRAVSQKRTVFLSSKLSLIYKVSN